MIQFKGGSGNMVSMDTIFRACKNVTGICYKTIFWDVEIG